MLTRRQFGSCSGAAVLALATVRRPDPAGATVVTSRFAALGDAWREAWRAYEGVPDYLSRCRWPFEKGSREFMSRRHEYDRVSHAMRALLEAPARSRGDVLLKYHVLDESFYFICGDPRFEEATRYRWCLALEREAVMFDAPIKRYWRPAECRGRAEISGESNKRAGAWREIEPWLLPMV